MAKRTLDELDARRLALLDRLVHQIAFEQDLDTAEGIPPNLRIRLAYEAERVYADWCGRAKALGRPIPSDGSAVQTILAELYDLDDLVNEIVHGGPRLSDTLN